jgi:hypothetical protein
MSNINPIPSDANTDGATSITMVSSLMKKKGAIRKSSKRAQAQACEPTDANAKEERQTILKSIESQVKSGKPFFATASGKFYASTIRSKADQILLRMIRCIEPELLKVPIDHDFPALDAGAPKVVGVQPVEKTFQLLEEAFRRKRPREFKAIVSALLAAMREPELELDSETVALLCEAQRGPVNIIRLAEKVAMGEHWRPGRLTINKYPLSLQKKVDSIPGIEKNLRRRAKRLNIVIAEAGRPKDADN